MGKRNAPEDLGETESIATAQEMVEQFLGKKLKKEPEKKPERKTISNSQWERATSDVKRMLETGQWQSAAPRHFVCLYEMLHEKVYGIKPIELGPTERLHAAGMAGRMFSKHFGDNPSEFVAYMKWAWIREESREKWRKEHERDGGRLGWKLMFNGSLLTDFHLFAKRKRG